MTSTSTSRLTQRAFDPQLFNFTRADQAELVCIFRTNADTAVIEIGSQRSDLKGDLNDLNIHPVFVNPSPLLRGHSLLVPRMRACLPQLATRDMLLIALRFLAAAQ